LLEVVQIIQDKVVVSALVTNRDLSGSGPVVGKAEMLVMLRFLTGYGMDMCSKF
jgi:hypothetical protein